nr:MAG TPA: hypothetical protein [Caudoviricetes sp.]
MQVNIQRCLILDPQPPSRPTCGEVQKTFPLIPPQVERPDLLHPTAAGLLGKDRNNLARLTNIERMATLPIRWPLFFVHGAPNSRARFRLALSRDARDDDLLNQLRRHVLRLNPTLERHLGKRQDRITDVPNSTGHDLWLLVVFFGFFGFLFFLLFRRIFRLFLLGLFFFLLFFLLFFRLISCLLSCGLLGGILLAAGFLTSRRGNDLFSSGLFDIQLCPPRLNQCISCCRIKPSGFPHGVATPSLLEGDDFHIGHSVACSSSWPCLLGGPGELHAGAPGDAGTHGN